MVNAVMSPMGALQPGIPNLTMIPEHWEIMIIDLKDYYFTIPLHPDDAPKFAFSLPSVNHDTPMEQYH